ncbi:MAG: NUDIX domain-containing protein [Candidatus Aenigmarchaeota archaeon]|nr:NUDIX domain-containing protein [Candidatus Aenigmarchaeota archaeon]
MKLSEKKSVRHFTATAYIVDNGKILLVNHKKLGMWLPIGGHVEENETPDQAVIRETKEETGLDAEIIRLSKHAQYEYPRAEILHTPYVISLQNIKDDHQHIDLEYVCNVKGKKILKGTEECKWFTANEIKNLENCPPEAKEFAADIIKTVNA